MDLEQRITALEKENADLKRQLEERLKTAINTAPKVEKIGLCVNCKHAEINLTEEPCYSCNRTETLFKNFVSAVDEPKSKLCETCRNNIELSTKNEMLLDAGRQGFPCKVCANEYFFEAIN